MSKIKFKTNLKCEGCVAAVKPGLDALTPIEKWEVDLKDPEKVLTVEGHDIDAEQISGVFRQAGYVAEKQN